MSSLIVAAKKTDLDPKAWLGDLLALFASANARVGSIGTCAIGR